MTVRRSELIWGAIYFAVFAVVVLVIAFGCTGRTEWNLSD